MTLSELDKEGCRYGNIPASGSLSGRSFLLDEIGIVDWFARLAMQELIRTDHKNLEAVSQKSYSLAKAMCDERTKL